MEKKDNTAKFNSLIKRVIEFIECDKDEEAREVFNRDIFPEFKEIIWDTQNPLNKFVFLFCQLDEYLNNKGAIIANVINKEKVLDDYYGDCSDKFGKI